MACTASDGGRVGCKSIMILSRVVSLAVDTLLLVPSVAEVPLDAVNVLCAVPAVAELPE